MCYTVFVEELSCKFCKFETTPWSVLPLAEFDNVSFVKVRRMLERGLIRPPGIALDFSKASLLDSRSVLLLVTLGNLFASSKEVGLKVMGLSAINQQILTLCGLSELLCCQLPGEPHDLPV